MRAMVEDKLSQDWTEEQIKSFFVEGYGPRVLMEPPREGIDLMVWLVPPAGLGMAAIMLYVALRFMTRRQSAERAGPSYAFGLSGEERDAYFARVEELAYDGSEITGQNDRATEPEEKGVN